MLIAAIAKNNFMKRIFFLITCFIAFYGVACCQPVNVPFTTDKWSMEGAQTSQETYLGKQCILVKTGAIIAKGIDLRDGVIEFDMSFPAGRGFPGIGFRIIDMSNFEHFYVRPHQAGNPDATQYTPVFNNYAGWQLYHGKGYSEATPLQPDQWHHIKIDMHGLEAEIYFDNMNTPLIKVTELKHGWKGGSIGLITGGLPTRYANLQYTIKEQNTPVAVSVPANGADGLITRYQVSQQLNRNFFEEKMKLTPAIKSKLKWTAQSTESSGTINLAKFTQLNDTGKVMIARVVIRSEEDQVKGIVFGFSDYVLVYLNDQLIYSGIDNYRSRDYRYLGTIGFFDMLFLPLKKGDNELWFAVSEDFGGWGLKAKLADMTKISFR
jgi:hypothetical protein